MGRDAELEAFLAGVQKRAYRMAELVTRNPDDALEIVQDAMTKLVERYRDRDRTEWPPLFYRILTHRIRDWQRRRRLRFRWFRTWADRPDGAGAEEGEPEMPDPLSADPPRLLQAQEGIEALLEALRALPDRQREAFLLRVWEGLDTRQAAEAMECSEGSVKTHLSRAMNSIRKRVGMHWP
ncbi:MAG: RNA polymerase sigma factor [Gammaproteobacteria bacterium]|nr:MAG: RNA polymerase sigma factor [Gammaproteobacteria bacterium]